MCNIIRLHAMFKQAGNKYDSQQNQDFPPQYIDDFFYDSLLDYLRMCVTTKPVNGYMLGFESNQQRIDMIQPYVKHSLLNPIYDKRRGKQRVTVFKLPKDYYLSTADVFSFDKCGNTIRVDIVQYQNLESYLDERDQLLWQQAYATFKGNELHVFYPELLKNLEMNYVSLPDRPYVGGYDSLEHQNSQEGYQIGDPIVNTLVPEGYCHILVDIAVQNVFGNLRDYNLAQFKQQNLNL